MKEDVETAEAPAVAEAGPPALEVEGLSHAFGAKQALDEVSFQVPQRRFTVLLGPNGAGKTTLFSLITRLYDTRRGRICVLGHDIGRESGYALQAMGVVFQARTLDLDLSLIQNLLYHAALHGLGRQEARTRAEAELAAVDLLERRREKARTLSGGQMRRLEIARALLHRPRLLLLDEPTVGLDIESRRDILARVRRLAREEGLGVLWATHLIDEVEDDDRVVVLHRGEVRARGGVAEVVAANGVADIGAAFMKLVSAG